TGTPGTHHTSGDCATAELLTRLYRARRPVHISPRNRKYGFSLTTKCRSGFSLTCWFRPLSPRPGPELCTRMACFRLLVNAHRPEPIQNHERNRCENISARPMVGRLLGRHDRATLGLELVDHSARRQNRAGGQG